MILALCFLPLIILFVFLKLTLLLSESSKEIEHVREESRRPHTYLENVYADADEEDEGD